MIYVTPDSVLAYFNLGNMYLYQRRLKEAAREFGNAIRLLEKRPKDEQVRFCEDFTVEFLLRACRNTLAQISRRGEDMKEYEKIEAYLSSVRHDLRSQLMVVREGTSMILDGLGDSKCDNCFTLLRPALECTDELNKLIGELLSISRFNAILAPRHVHQRRKTEKCKDGTTGKRVGNHEG